MKDLLPFSLLELHGLPGGSTGEEALGWGLGGRGCCEGKLHFIIISQDLLFCGSYYTFSLPSQIFENILIFLAKTCLCVIVNLKEKLIVCLFLCPFLPPLTPTPRPLFLVPIKNNYPFLFLPLGAV